MYRIPSKCSTPLIVAPPLFGIENHIITYSNYTLYPLKVTHFDQRDSEHELK